MKTFLNLILLTLVLSVTDTPITSENTFAEETNQNSSIKIGVIAPLSGGYSRLGSDFVSSIRLAIKQSTANLNVNLIIEDDAFLPAKALTAARKLLELDKIDGLINLSTPAITAIYDQINAQGLPVLQLGIFEKSNIKDNIFILQPEPNAAVNEFANFVKSKSDGSTIDMFYYEDPDVLKLVTQFKKIYDSKNLKGEVNLISVGNQIIDIKSLVLKSVAKKPQHVAFGLTPEFAAELIKNFRLLDQKPQFYSMWNLELGKEMLYQKVGDAVLVGQIYFSTTRSEISKTFINDFTKAYQHKPEPFSELGYDAAKVLLDSFAKDRKIWIENISKYNLPGVSGKIQFDESGSLVGQSKIMQLKDIPRE